MIFLIGPIPPPVDGRAQSTAWLKDALRADGHAVRVFDTHVRPFIKMLRCLSAAATLLFRVRPERVIVVASGDLGLLAESIPLLAARLRRVATTMTHHSAHYVRGESWLFRLALATGGSKVRHAVLDEAMRVEISRAYGIDQRRVVVVDNAGLMPASPCVETVASRTGVLHLSNLSVAKGLSAVLEVAARTGLRVRLIGTVSPEASAVLADARSRGVPFECVGPRHGNDKHRALTAGRCFLFLSSYQHEAQPLVLYEAMAAGCLPVVWDAGWIGQQMHRVGLDENVFEVNDIDGVVAAIQRIVTMDDASFAAWSNRVRTAFEEHRRRCSMQYKAVTN